LLLSLLTSIATHAETLTVSNTNNDGPGSLRELINNAADGDLITFSPDLVNLSIVLNTPIAINRNLTVTGPGADLLQIDGAGANQLFQIRNGAQVKLSGLSFVNGNSTSGGAISNSENSLLSIEDSFFTANFASSRGGAIDNNNAELFIRRSTLSENTTLSLGGAINNMGRGLVSIDTSTLALNRSTNFDGGAITNLDGRLEIINSTIVDNFADNFAGGIGNNTPSSIPLIRNSIVASNNTGTGSGLEFGNLAPAAAIISSGSNLIGIVQGPGDGNTDTVFNTNPTDQFGTVSAPLDPLLPPLSNFGGTVPTQQPQDNSPTIDRGSAEMLNLGSAPELPCSYKDARGLGRPQDANGDGIFECDIGSVELQAGEPLTAAQSGSFFDPARNGEGTFIEILEGGEQAVVATFSYAPAGDSSAWFIGIGDIVGNTIVVDDIQISQGGVFGSAFDASNITTTTIGSMSFIFPDCEASQSSGKLAFESASGSNYQDLLVNANRLTSVIDCDNSMANPAAGRSGSFFAPERNGEGIFVEWLSDGNAVVIWYTYDLQGRQLWLISSGTTIEGNRLSANMLFPQETTSFGNLFDPNEIDLQAWGTVTLEYQTGCNDINFSYQSNVDGFGSGGYNYTRLSTLAEVDCDL